MAHEIRSRSYYARDHRRRPAVPVQFASLERTCVDSAVEPRSARSSRLVTPITLSSRANRGCRWFFDDATFCKLCALVKRTLRSVIRARTSPLPYRRTSFAILRIGRVPFAAGESSEDMRLARRANPHCCKVLSPVNQTRTHRNWGNISAYKVEF